MRKIIALLLGIIYAFGGMFALPTRAEEPTAAKVDRCVYILNRDSNTSNPLIQYEEADIEIICKIVGVPKTAKLLSSSYMDMGSTSSFFHRRGLVEMDVVDDVKPGENSRDITFYMPGIQYSGNGNVFEIDGELRFDGDIIIPLEKSILVSEADKVGEAEEPKLQPYIVKYEVSSPKIAKGDVFSVVMEIVDPNYRYSDLVSKSFDSSIALLSDKNFNSSNMQGSISNIGNDAMGNLKYEVRFNNITYAGPESLLEFRVTYRAQVLKDGKVYNTTSDKIMTRTIFETTNAGGNDAEYMPNVLITNYTGSGGVVAGKRLDFKVTFKNMSETVPVTNVIIAVDGGADFAMAKGVNKIFVNNIDPQKEIAIDLSMIANKMAAPSSYPIKFDVTYNYAGKSNGAMTSEIAIPITQQDRVRINYVKVQNAWIDSEVEVNYSVLNTGLSSVKNAQIEVFDEANNSMAILFLGNIEPGKEAKGTNMYLTFNESREYQLSMKLTYEDENFNQKELIEPFTVGVQGGGYFPPIDPEPFPPMEEPVKKNNNLLFFGGAAVIAAGVVGFVIWKRKKNKQGVIDDEDL